MDKAENRDPLEGWMYKLDDRSSAKTWNKCWVSVHNNVFRYYNDNPKYKESNPEGSILLSETTYIGIAKDEYFTGKIEENYQNTEGCQFQINVGELFYRFRCDSPTTTRYWVDRLFEEKCAHSIQDAPLGPYINRFTINPSAPMNSCNAGIPSLFSRQSPQYPPPQYPPPPQYLPPQYPPPPSQIPQQMIPISSASYCSFPHDLKHYPACELSESNMKEFLFTEGSVLRSYLSELFDEELQSPLQQQHPHRQKRQQTKQQEENEQLKQSGFRQILSACTQPLVRSIVGTYLALRILEWDHRVRNLPQSDDRDDIIGYILCALQYAHNAQLYMWSLDAPRLLTLEDHWLSQWINVRKHVHGLWDLGAGRDYESRLKWSIAFVACLKRHFLSEDRTLLPNVCLAIMDAVDNLFHCLLFKLRHDVASSKILHRLWQTIDLSKLLPETSDRERLNIKTLVECSMIFQILRLENDRSRLLHCDSLLTNAFLSVANVLSTCQSNHPHAFSAIRDPLRDAELHIFASTSQLNSKNDPVQPETTTTSSSSSKSQTRTLSSNSVPSTENRFLDREENTKDLLGHWRLNESESAQFVSPITASCSCSRLQLLLLLRRNLLVLKRLAVKASKVSRPLEDAFLECAVKVEQRLPLDNTKKSLDINEEMQNSTLDLCEAIKILNR